MHLLPPLSLALLAGTVGCSALTDFDRYHRSGDGGTEDGSTIRRDSGPCEDPSAEVCNGEDDDCNGEVDEGFELASDPLHCGRCNRACPGVPNSEPGCEAGDCAAQCDTGYGDCDEDYLTGCETDLTSADDCGSCGNQCELDSFCSRGSCVSDCLSGEMVCGRACVDTGSSPVHCGSCGNACPSASRATGVCAAGSCALVCNAGFDDCNGDAADGCETDLSTVTDCGSCDAVCTFPNGMPACSAGACELAGCNGGHADCNGVASDGCEADLASTATCGGCGAACADPPNAVGVCGASGCTFTCNGGRADCNGVASDGCEADLSAPTSCGSCTTACSGGTPLCSGSACVSGCSGATPTRCGSSCVSTAVNPLHCGACGNACIDRAHSEPTCASGMCGISCDAGWADCSGGAADGCETSIWNVSNCGSCGTVCTLPRATPSCASGTCAIASCDTGYRDCNGMAADGCEVDIRTPANCGSCGMVCTVANGTPACSAGACAIGTCNTGYSDCDGAYANGCEEMRRTYYRDADGDGYGLTTVPMQYCAAALPSGWSLTPGDCDDGRATVNPMAAELCNAMDDDCDLAIDEGYAVGSSCSCPGGGGTGTTVCSGPSSTTCSYPAETCNGQDDNCNGVADETFTCVRGSALACTVSIGACTAMGTQICNGMCTGYGTCTPAELCNRADDTCDGFVDESVLVRGTTREVTSSSADARADYSESRREIGIVYGAYNGTNWSVFFARVDVAGNLLATPVSVGTSGWPTWDIAWDGYHWTIVMPDVAQSPLRIYRVEAGSDRVFTTGMIGPSAAGNAFVNARIDQLGTGAASAGQLTIAWTESGMSRGRGTRYSVGTSAMATGSPVGTTFDGVPSGDIALDVATFSTATGTFVAWIRWITSPRTQEIRWTHVQPTGVSSVNSMASDAEDKGRLEVAFDSAATRVGIVFGRSTATTSRTSFHTLDLSVGVPSAETSLGSLSDVAIAWAGDQSFAIIGNGASGGVFRRYRSSDRALIPADIALGSARMIEGIPSGSGRYVVITADLGVSSIPIDCP